MTLFTLAAGQFEVLKCLWKDTVKSSWIKAIIKTVHVVIKKKKKKKKKQTNKERKKKKERKHPDCAANRRYLAYFLLFMSFYKL